jgi:formate/nitrite transporter
MPANDSPTDDAYTPAEIARRVEAAGIAKTELKFVPLLTLAVLAGAFIALGAAFYTLTVTGNVLGFGIGRLVGGLAFSMGLILVVVGGAELFTGNNLIVMALAEGKITLAAMLRNWGIVYAGNFVGALGTVALVLLSGTLTLADGGVGATAREIAEAKLALPLIEAFFRGILCNALVCLAIWLSYAGRRVVDKIFAIVFPISAFVASGFEHSVANMYLIPLGFWAGAPLDLGGYALNLVAVTAGNVIGGGVLVALVYWLVYLRPAR